MTDLSKGIIEIEGVVLSKNTCANDFINLNNPNIDVKISKRGHTYINFLNPIVFNDIAMFVKVACYTNSDVPEIKLFPSIPPSVVDHGYGEIPKYKLDAAKQWLKGMINSEPKTSNDSCVFYKFDDVDYFSSISEDIHYGLIGGEINITFHGA